MSEEKIKMAGEILYMCETAAEVCDFMRLAVAGLELPKDEAFSVFECLKVYCDKISEKTEILIHSKC